MTLSKKDVLAFLSGVELPDDKLAAIRTALADPESPLRQLLVDIKRRSETCSGPESYELLRDFKTRVSCEEVKEKGTSPDEVQSIVIQELASQCQWSSKDVRMSDTLNQLGCDAQSLVSLIDVLEIKFGLYHNACARGCIAQDLFNRVPLEVTVKELVDIVWRVLWTHDLSVAPDTREDNEPRGEAVGGDDEEKEWWEQ